MVEKNNNVAKQVLTGIGGAVVAFGLTYAIKQSQVNTAEAETREVRQKAEQVIDNLQQEHRDELQEKNTYIADIKEKKEDIREESSRFAYQLGNAQQNNEELELKYDATLSSLDSLGVLLQDVRSDAAQLERMLVSKDSKLDSLSNELTLSEKEKQMLNQEINVYKDSLNLANIYNNALIKGGSWLLFNSPDFGEGGAPSFDINYESAPVVPYTKGFFPQTRKETREVQNFLKN